MSSIKKSWIKKFDQEKVASSKNSLVLESLFLKYEIFVLHFIKWVNNV